MKAKIKQTQRLVYSGITAEARKIGISHTHLRHILDGNRRPGDALRAKMAKAGYRFESDGTLKGATA